MSKFPVTKPQWVSFIACPVRQVILLLGIFLLISMEGCQNSSKIESNNASQSQSTEQEFDRTLTLDDVELEQADQKGKLLWRIQSKQVSYSQDQKIATVKNPEGELFEAGELLYKIKADQGEFYQDGKKIFLRGNVVATDPNNGLVLKGKELEWIVEQSIIVVRKGITGDHAKLNAIASEAQVFYKKKQVEFWDKVIVGSKDPVVKLQSDHIIWHWDKQTLTSDQKVNLERYQNQTITDRGIAETGELNLDTQVATLKKNAQLALSSPALQISTNELQWNYQKQTLNSPEPITLYEREQQVTFRSNQGWGDLKEKIFYLVGDVVGIRQERQAQLNTDQLTWYVPQQSFSAEGNVVYRQVDPPLNLMGQKATGKFDQETVVVSSPGNQNQVVTEIVP